MYTVTKGNETIGGFSDPDKLARWVTSKKFIEKHGTNVRIHDEKPTDNVVHVHPRQVYMDLTKTQAEVVGDFFESIKLVARRGEAACDMGTNYEEVHGYYESLRHEMESLRQRLTDIERINTS